MTRPRQLKLAAIMRPASIHTGAWRYPDAFPDANFNFAHLKRFAQTLERGKFDAFFMADHMAVLNMPLDALKRSHTVTSFEPFTLLSALSQVTERIGLVATGSTFDAPYHIARRFASLDHLSGGRAGWNIVTTSNPDAALNFGMEEHMEHSERYARAREFYDVVTGLWDTWADDAFVRDVERAFISILTSCMCSTTRASICRCVARLTSRGPSRAGRSSFRQAPPKPAANLQPKRRKRCSLRNRASPWGESSMPT
jgi:alkanesulfonate monooxygenase